jgi:hypothetical protein
MARMIPANERLKHRYLDYLKQAKGRDEKTLDKVAAALNEFEAIYRLEGLQAVLPPLGRGVQDAPRESTQ